MGQHKEGQKSLRGIIGSPERKKKDYTATQNIKGGGQPRGDGESNYDRGKKPRSGYSHLKAGEDRAKWFGNI